MNIDTPSPAPLAAPLALIAGPTASGKSALALALAARANGVVINADSAQVYRDLAVLSARPTAADEARAPHRLYGTRDGAIPCSAADWAEDARHAVFEVHRAGKLPILVGGTGLYVRTLLEGIAPVPEIDPEIRAAVRAMPVSQSFEALRREDPAAAQRLRPSDTARVARALEVVRSTGTPLADWHQHRSGGIADQVSLRPLILLPPRDWLIRRCEDRFAAMMGKDGLEEVRRLLDRNLNPLLPVMRAIGVRELAAMLAGEATAEQALEQGQAATRRYAKRQYTWFSRQPPADWPRLRDPLDDGAAFAAAVEMLTSA
jgi:tRNA dimethylallyltransferase